MIEQGFTKLVQPEGQPILGFKERAYLPCGCSCWVGIRFDDHEPAVAITPCSPEHEELVKHFDLLVRESLVEPPQHDRLFVEVAEELLEQAARAHGVAA